MPLEMGDAGASDPGLLAGGATFWLLWEPSNTASHPAANVVSVRYCVPVLIPSLRSHRPRGPPHDSCRPAGAVAQSFQGSAPFPRVIINHKTSLCPETQRILASTSALILFCLLLCFCAPFLFQLHLLWLWVLGQSLKVESGVLGLPFPPPPSTPNLNSQTPWPAPSSPVCHQDLGPFET